MRIYELRVERTWWGRTRYMAKVRNPETQVVADWREITEQELIDSVANLRNENLNLTNHISDLAQELKGVRCRYPTGGRVPERAVARFGESTPGHQVRPAGTLSKPVVVDVRADAAAPLTDLELELIDSIAGERLRKSVRTDLPPPPPHSPGFKASSVGTKRPPPPHRQPLPTVAPLEPPAAPK